MPRPVLLPLLLALALLASRASGAAAARAGARCSAAPAWAWWQARRAACLSGEVCVLRTLGRVWGDRGRCRRLTAVPDCEVPVCAAKGALAACRTGSRVATCAAWATRKDGGKKPVCKRACPENCIIGPSAPKDNKGKSYCNVCFLQLASCEAKFAIYGPVKQGGGLPLPKPGECSTSPSQVAGASPPGPKCPSGKTCVLFDFGQIAADRPNKGSCETVKGPVPQCTLNLCTAKGAAEVCKTADTKDVTTCGAWAMRKDGGKKPMCQRSCPENCIIGPSAPKDNKGKSYCNVCFLRLASCEAKFAIYGPVKQGGGLPLPPPGECSTSPSQVAGAPPPGPKCPSGKTCVLFDFGQIAADRPNKGSCKTVKTPVPQCTFDLCTAKGAATVCETAKTKDVTTCGAWAKRSDGGTKPRCQRGCPRNCIRGPSAPKDNNGKSYCNVCVLQVASCEADFAIYGPVKQGGGLPLPPPGECSTSPSQVAGAPPPGPKCPSGKMCVISDFGNLASDKRNSGTCKAVASPVQVCTYNFCTGAGAAAVCKTVDTKDVTTCGAWATRSDGGEKPNCVVPCRYNCLISGRPVDSNGKSYCNECLLRVESCLSNFALYGPVCSTKGSRRGPVKCPGGGTCVMDDFGFPAADKPNSGMCKKVSTPVPSCTYNLCTSKGAGTVCETEDTKDVTTCGGWAARSDGNAKPKCEVLCPLFCLVDNKPRDNNGKEYCSACQLQSASCAANFEFYGPVSKAG